MEHYRLAIGLTSPYLNTLPETQFVTKQRKIKSAKVSAAPGTSISVDVDVKKLRTPSAPLGLY